MTTPPDGGEPGTTRRPFPIMRALRILVVAIATPLAFGLSRRIGEASGNPQLPGFFIAIGVLAFLLSVRAVLTEFSRGPEANRQKDFLWGVAAGGWLTVLIRP